MSFGYRFATHDRHPASGHVEFPIYGQHVVENSWGAEVHPEADWFYQKADEVLVKGMDPSLISYAVSVSPQFGEHVANLRARGISKVVLGGWIFPACVGNSALAYNAQGFETYVLRDMSCVLDIPPAGLYSEKMMKILELSGVKVITVDQLG